MNNSYGAVVILLLASLTARADGIMTPEERAARLDEAQSRDLRANYERLQEMNNQHSWSNPAPQAPREDSFERAQRESQQRLDVESQAIQRRLQAGVSGVSADMVPCSAIANEARAAGKLDNPAVRDRVGACLRQALQNFDTTVGYAAAGWSGVYFMDELESALSDDNYRYFHSFLTHSESSREMAAREAARRVEEARRKAEWEAKNAAIRRQMEEEDERRHDAFDEGAEAGKVIAKACQIAPLPAQPPRVFKDCRDCPDMVVAPAGRFRMGAEREEQEPLKFHSILPKPDVYLMSSPRETVWQESPVHDVKIAKPFAVGRFAVTFDEWKACLADGGCDGIRPSDGGMGEGRQPVVNVSWDMAQSYVKWLSRKTGKTYRLPTEAEREYVARAGSPLAFPCLESGKDGAAWWSLNRTERSGKHVVGGFGPNAFGLHDTVAGVLEWVQDCALPDYSHAPADGRAAGAGMFKSCPERVVRGAHWRAHPFYARNANRFFQQADNRDIFTGFRVVRDLDEAVDSLPYLAADRVVSAATIAPGSIADALAAAERNDWTAVQRLLKAWPEIGEPQRYPGKEDPPAARARFCEVLVGKGLALEGSPEGRVWKGSQTDWSKAAESYDTALTREECRLGGLPESVKAQVHLRLGKLFENGSDTQYFEGAEVFYRKARELGAAEAEGHLAALAARRQRGDQEAYRQDGDIAHSLSDLLVYKVFTQSPGFRPAGERMAQESLTQDSIPALLAAANAALHPFNSSQGPDYETAVDQYGRAARRGNAEAIAWFQSFYDRFAEEHKSSFKEYPNRKYNDLYRIFLKAGAAGSPQAAAVAERFVQEHRAWPIPVPQAALQWQALPKGSLPLGDKGKVKLKAFEVSQTPVTFRQYQACVQAGACTAAHLDDGECHVHTSLNAVSKGVLPERFRSPDQPAVCVDWSQARAFAAWAGGRLPSESEYEYAANNAGTGPDYLNDRTPYGCYEAQLTFDEGKPGCGANATAPVCAAYDGYTDQGVCDLYGNVWEWTGDGWTDDRLNMPDNGSPHPVEGLPDRVLRGAGWADRPTAPMSARRIAGGAGRADDDVGFRVARGR